jgi:hypothetical protein
MPFSPNDSGRGSRQTSKPASWFTAPAIERIARCVTSDLSNVEGTDSSIVDEYLQSPPLGQYSDLRIDDFIDERSSSVLEHIRFYIFAGLIELATATGYIDLNCWPSLTSFRKALEHFLASLASEKSPPDLTLMKDLMARLNQGQLRIPTLDKTVFCAFESYLHLTSVVQMDLSFHDFVWETSSDNPQWPNVDLSFLLSPRLFSEALGNGTVAGIPAPGVRNGLIALDYFRWITEILDRVSYNSDISNKIIRHASWSHRLLQVRKRFAVWTRRMGEWVEPVGGSGQLSDETEEMWPALRPLESELKLLNLDTDRDVPISFDLGQPYLRLEEEIIAEADQLISEGRNGAARQVLRAEISNIDGFLREEQWAVPEPEPDIPFGETPEATVEDTDPIEILTSRLLRLCTKLAELGDVDGAAVFLVRHDYAAMFGPGHRDTKRAHAILAQSREAGLSDTATVAGNSAEATVAQRE